MTGNVTFGDYGATNDVNKYNCVFDFDDLSSPKFEIEFTRNAPSPYQPDRWELVIRTLDSSEIVSSNSSDGLSDANGTPHSSGEGTHFRDIISVPSSFMSSWRQQYVDWGKKGFVLDGKNITITKVTLLKE